MKLVVTGATGFIGTATKRWLHWTPGALREWGSALDGVDGVINLAGEPIATKWTHTTRQRIETSRIVLGSGGGALAKMVVPFKFFAGGPVGSGQQWMSWIQLEDHVRLMLEVIENTQASGAINATAPAPVRNKEFCQTLGKVLGRPCWAPVPALALRLLLGEMAEMLLTGQRVIPAAAQKLGFQFRYPNLEEALRASMSL